MEAVIEMKNVSFQAQNQTIVRDFSFQFEKGKVVALVGPSGSGKSTVLKLAAGLLVPASGDVFFQGRNLFMMTREQNLSFRKQAAMVFQDSALWANQSLYQILELPLKLHFPQMDKQERDQRMNDVLAQVGYRKALSVRPAQLSMGEQKLIAFARAMLCGPNLLFLDEWTESLDDASAQCLVNLVWERRRNNDSIIFVSHDYTVIRYLADYIVMIVDGRFSQLFTREQVAQDEDMAHLIEKRIAL
ncbi:MAG: ATP-binding cassette domain-containing protein [Treponema sp.]|jgi:ABC-type glutathione transport system ATPase component|nr:ATP-binding cassette domain-containing protein [Treponema sp.]